jgi:hypothetical protein
LKKRPLEAAASDKAVPAKSVKPSVGGRGGAPGGSTKRKEEHNEGSDSDVKLVETAKHKGVASGSAPLPNSDSQVLHMTVGPTTIVAFGTGRHAYSIAVCGFHADLWHPNLNALVHTMRIELRHVTADGTGSIFVFHKLSKLNNG